MYKPMGTTINKTVHITVFLAFLLFSGCDVVSTTDKPVRLSLEVSPEVIEPVNRLNVTLVATNITGNELNLSFPSSCQYGFIIRKASEMYFDSTNEYGCLAVITHLNLAPGEQKTYEFSFEIDSEFDRGTYSFSAFLRENHSDTVSVPFRVETQ